MCELTTENLRGSRRYLFGVLLLIKLVIMTQLMPTPSRVPYWLPFAPLYLKKYHGTPPSRFKYSRFSILGSSNCICTETSHVLLMHEVQVVVAVRNTAAGTTVEEAPVKVEVFEQYLSSIALMRTLATHFRIK